MPVTFNVANHPANPVSWAPGKHLTRVAPALDKFLLSCSPREAKNCKEVLQTSFQEKDLLSLCAQKNGFVHTILNAYNTHHHLQLRPDDLWMAIVSQFSFYVNANAEDLRSKFVAHEGKKTLIVTRSGSRHSVDFGDVALEMTTLMDQFISDPELKDWILPKFSTTTPSDTIIYAIQMMSTLKAYFDFACFIDCGVPTITLLGEKADWEALLIRIEKFHSFGEETQRWANLLTPVVSRFVEAFDGNTDIEFWGRMVDLHVNGSGPSYLAGWITAFCFWDADGKLLHNTRGSDITKDQDAGTTRGIKVVHDSWLGMHLTIDGQHYVSVESDNIPQGYCDVPMLLNDNGEELDTIMIAGHLAAAVLKNPESGEWDIMRPAPGWFMFIENPKGVVVESDQVKKLKAELREINSGPISSSKKGKKGDGLSGTLKKKDGKCDIM